jgi:hypothetical protein
MPDAAQALTSLCVPKIFKEMKSKNETLAAQFSAAFPEWSSDKSDKKRMAMASIAVGCSMTEFRNIVTFGSFIGDVEEIASKATKSQAICESNRLKLERSWHPSSMLNLAPASDSPPSPSFFDEPRRSFGWAKVDEMGQALVNKYGLGYFALNECMSSSEAVQALSNLGASMALIANETGLGDQAIGLGGWGVRMGEPQNNSANLHPFLDSGSTPLLGQTGCDKRLARIN